MKPKKRMLAPVVLVLGIGTYAVLSRDRSPQGSFVASGTVEATEAQLGFQTAGRIETVGAREGDAVGVGDELGRLDRAEMQARHEQAQAEIEANRAVLSELERGSRSEEITQAEAARTEAAQRREDAERDLERTRRLREGGAVSQESLDKAALALDVARSLEQQAEQHWQLVRSGPRREKIAAQRAQLAQAEAALRVIDAMLEHMVVRAPFAGVVSVRHHEPGEIVAAGTPILTVLNRGDRWVRIYVPEHRLAAVRLGAPAFITCDTYPGKDYRGEVSFIASEAEFTPKSVQTTEERVKLVYAVKVRILEDPRSDLKPGMPVDVRLEMAP
ncbi:MAG TPA: HlyD family efflux transporter periplasmic adaptor subunit [Candidatus Krumholzibacteria bacterium]|nr:HlyD family efflux transporter periplasmic adaptor subunit [Candidatus Krumholzibacteria bacterium]